MPTKKQSADNVATLSQVYSNIALNIEKQQNIYTAEMFGRERISTECLVVDLLCGGGLLPCMVQFSGAEQSGKSTLLMHVLRSALKSFLPWIGVWDAEGSIIQDYVNNILVDYDINQLIDSKRVHYFRRMVLEEVYDFLAEFLQKLPDIVYHSNAGCWVYQIPKRDPHFAKLANDLHLIPDKKLSDNPNFWYCPGADAKPKGILFIDSYAALVVRAIDEQSKGMNRRAAEAAAFSAGIKRVVGRLANKGFIIFGTNQIRKNPDSSYGKSPLYEPGGEALNFYSSIRCRSASRTTPKEWEVDKTANYQAIEKSAFVEGEMDHYAFKFFKNTKNKITTPNLEGWVRIWTRDHEGMGRGIDPVFDIYEYAKITNQLEGSLKRGFRINYEPIKHITFDFYTFKCMILGEFFKDKPLWQWAASKVGLNKPALLRQYFFKQLATGEALKRIGKLTISNDEEMSLEVADNVVEI